MRYVLIVLTLFIMAASPGQHPTETRLKQLESMVELLKMFVDAQAANNRSFIQQLNELTMAHNDLISEHEALVVEHNKLRHEYNVLASKHGFPPMPYTHDTVIDSTPLPCQDCS